MANMDVVVVGGSMVDLVSFSSRLPKPGETLHGNKFVQGFGGKGANQCIVAARLGAHAAMVGKVGDDMFGHDYIANYKKNNVNIDHVGMAEGKATGVALINVDEQAQNSIVIISSANLQLIPEDVQKAESVIKSAKVLVCQLETRNDTAIAAMRMAKQHGVTTILNPAPAQAQLDSEMYTLCDVFCPNETEAEILVGQPITNISDASKATEILLDRGCSKVIITMGSQGSIFATKDNRTPVHVPVKKVTPVDTTGAGDAFVGSLAFYLAKYPSMPLQEAIKRSGEYATISVTAAGTQTSFPWRKDLPAWLLEQ